MVKLIDRPDMTLDVYRGRKTTIQQLSADKTPHPKTISRTIMVVECLQTATTVQLTYVKAASPPKCADDVVCLLIKLYVTPFL